MDEGDFHKNIKKYYLNIFPGIKKPLTSLA